VTLVVRHPNRRSFFFALPQVALTAACAFGAAHSAPPAPTDAPSTGITPGGLQPTEPPATQEPEATPRRALPLPTPGESEWLWLEEWLKFISLTHKRVSSGC
jgi:hypothetical protein